MEKRKIRKEGEEKKRGEGRRNNDDNDDDGDDDRNQSKRNFTKTSDWSLGRFALRIANI